MSQIQNRALIPLICLLVVAIIAACGDDDGGDSPDGSLTPSPTTIEGQLASVLLQDEDIPDGLQGSGLAFSTNEQLAGPNEAELARFIRLGRQLGVDLTYIPTEELPADNPVRGGIQNSASVYISASGASESFQETEVEARNNDWKLLYDDLTDVNVSQVDIPVGDESYWVRITGFEQCIIEAIGTATPNPALPSPTCRPAKLVIDDYVIFRTGRVRSLLKVLSAHANDSSADIFQDQVKAWADLVVQRSLVVFPTPGP